MARMSFPRRRESSFFHEDFKLFNSWIPASAGMTESGKFLTILLSMYIKISISNVQIR